MSVSEFRIQEQRLASGPLCGRLRVTVEVTVNNHYEMAVAKVLDVYEQAEENLSKPKTKRGVGPVASLITDRMVEAYEATVREGLKLKRKRAT